MNTKDLTIKFPKLSEYDIYLYDEICLDSAEMFGKSLIERVNEIKEFFSDSQQIINEYCKNIVLEIPNIKVHLSTPGGDVYPGFAIANKISEINFNNNFPNIDIIGEGFVMSMGISILLSVPFEQRFAYKDTTFMIHAAQGLAIGCLEEIEDSVAEMKRLTNRIYDLIIKETKITQEQLDHYEERKKDWIIDADTALELGLISKII